MIHALCTDLLCEGRDTYPSVFCNLVLAERTIYAVCTSITAAAWQAFDIQQGLNKVDETLIKTELFMIEEKAALG